MKKLTNYYILSELLNFDTYLVSVVVNHFKDIDIDIIFKHLQDLNIEEYQDAINEALDMPLDQLKLISQDSWFKSESSYIRYLVSLLELNNIEFIEYKPKREIKKEFNQGRLF